MSRPNRKTTFEKQVLALLAAHPRGESSPELQAGLRPRISQPTLSRLLLGLRARGLVTQTGAARATLYHLVGGRIGAAELRSRLLHEDVAKQLVRHPELKATAADRLGKLKKANPSGRRYHQRWAELLNADMPMLLRAMTEESESAAALRRESPFTVLFDQAERKRLYKRAGVGHLS
ncbi:MAG: hypothetical protein ACRESU_04150 [Gammaproteobacteria bacterium]